MELAMIERLVVIVNVRGVMVKVIESKIRHYVITTEEFPPKFNIWIEKANDMLRVTT